MLPRVVLPLTEIAPPTSRSVVVPDRVTSPSKVVAPTVPVNVIVSELALPRVVLPITEKLLATLKVPPRAEFPETLKVPPRAEFPPTLRSVLTPSKVTSPENVVFFTFALKVTSLVAESPKTTSPLKVVVP